MWHIIKSELQYKKNILYGCLAITTVILAIPGAFAELTTSDEILQMIINSMICYFIFIGNVGGGNNREFQRGFTILIPVQLRTIGMTRLVLMIVVPLCVAILWTIFMVPFMNNTAQSNFLLISSLYGLCVCISLLQPIFRDLKYYLRSYRLKAVALIAVVTLIVIIMGISGYLVFSLEKLDGLLRSPYSAISLNVAWPILACFSVWLFQQRRTYVR